MTAITSSQSQVDIAELILREHDALRHKLAKVHTVLAEPGPNSAEIETSLREFLNALIVHFANEEDDGFFMKIATKAPRLASCAGRLSVEHRELLKDAEELCRFATAGSPSVVWWRELKNRCDVFDAKLMRHECEENHLLQDARRLETGGCDKR
jgi:iron-sulfur cluster repair protein YtfE (RIC family)